MLITFDKTIGRSEVNYGYINLTTDNGITHGGEFPPSNTPLLIFTGDRNYKASINTSQNQIWGGLRRWFRDENIYQGDKIRITYDTILPQIDGRVRIDISIIDRAELSIITPVEAMLTETKDEDERVAEVNMQMENDLENFLIDNLHLIDPDLKLYRDEQGKSGRQFWTPIGEIDILCKKKNDFVVIELKKGRSSDKVVGQISRYIGWVKENIAKDNNTKGIIIVHDFDPKLKYAVLANPNIDLKYYQIKIDFVTEQDVLNKND
ncbi:MAG: endonuclease NucS domain-containing protein [Bacteroidota bacterium]